MSNVGESQKTVAKGAFWSFTGTMALKLVSFVYTIIIARLFSEEQVGIFYLAMSVIYLVAIFGDLGINTAIGRYIPFYIGKGEKKKAYAVLETSYLFSGSLTAILSLVMFFTAGAVANSFSNPALAPAIEMLSIYLVFGVLFSLNCSFLAGLKKIKEGALLNNGQNILKLLLTIGMYLVFGREGYVITVAFTLSYIAFTIISFWYAGREAAKIGAKGSTNLTEKAALLREIMPLGLTLAIVAEIANIAFYTDRIMMGYLLPPEISAAKIGVYSIAVAMGMMILIFPGAITSIFSPVIAELHGKEDKEEMKKISKTAVRWNIFALFPITIVMLVFAKEILGIFYGSAYAEGAVVLAFFSIGIFFRMLSNVQTTILSSMRIIKVELYAAIIALVVNAVLDFYLIPIYGMDGAAMASAISLLLVSVMVTVYCKKITEFDFTAEAVRPVLAGIAAFAVLFLLRGVMLEAINSVPVLEVGGDVIISLIIQKMMKLVVIGLIFAAACLIYLFFLVIAGAIEHEDRGVFLGMLRRAGTPKGIISNVEKIIGHSNAP